MTRGAGPRRFHADVVMTLAGARPTIGPMTSVASTRSTRSEQITEVCIGFARETRYRSVRLGDLCALAGASERRVRDAFYECHGMAPTSYLRALALREARRALLAGGTERDAVTRAATDCGFEHLSRFAARYRTAFGEPPSATAARARSHTETQ